ncbi:hypothetical protein [Bradyrhizobium diazoefficiens]
MAPRTMRELERIRYWQGQLLASGDLRTQIDSDAELRALHNRALHRAYGVAIGLDFSLVVEDQQKPAGQLGCGVAYDCNGRALYVESNRRVALPPPTRDPLVLVLSHDPGSDEPIALTWKLPREVNPNKEIAVAGLIFDAGTPKPDRNFKPVVARTMARPRLATGTTIAGETPWKSWKIGDEEIGVEVTIDTSAAGYTRIPHYFAEAVEGNPSPDIVEEVKSQNTTIERRIPKRDLVWFASIAEPSPESFKLQLMLRGIARQALDPVDPKTSVADVPKLDGTIALHEEKDPFKIGDVVARLLPIGKQFSTITALSYKTGIATLDAPLQDADAKLVAFGNLPRTAYVTKILDPVSLATVTVNKPDSFNEDDVVIKFGAHPESARPAKVVSVDDSGTLELSKSIAGLISGDPLAIARAASNVVNVAGLDITVADSTPFSVGDVVVRLSDDFENATPARVTGMKPNNVLTLSAAIGLKQASILGIATVAANVVDVVNDAGAVKIQVNDAGPFRDFDLVARITGNAASRPVRVEQVKGKTLILSQAITDLKQNDVIAAASFPVRATVHEVTDRQLTLSDPTIFPKDAYVAHIDHLLEASAAPAAVNGSIGKTLVLEAEIPHLAKGNVIGLCAFPPTVRVQAISADSITVSDGNLIHVHDVVTAHGSLALVAEVQGNAVRLASEIANLVEGDSLAVATIRGTVTIKPGTGDSRVKVDQPLSLRKDDFLADITGWRQAQTDSSALAGVTAAGDHQITVSPLLDGLLTNDTVGLATVTEKFLQFRLDAVADVKPYDIVALAGFDQLDGTNRAMSARVYRLPSPDVVSLLLEANEPAFSLRPADISASVGFVRGSALAQIQKHDLFVNWLSCGDGDPLPKPCIAKPAPACPCTQLKE